jgi:hypothetical protein
MTNYDITIIYAINISLLQNIKKTRIILLLKNIKQMLF